MVRSPATQRHLSRSPSRAGWTRLPTCAASWSERFETSTPWSRLTSGGRRATFSLALVEDCRSAVEHSSRTLALRQRSSVAARRALDMLGGLTVTLEGVTLAVKPPTFATSQPAMLEDRLFQALELACEGAAAAH